MILSYVGQPKISLRVDEIARWLRGEIPELMMSASSGPKDYFKNQVFLEFEHDAALEEILIVRGRGDPFALRRRGEVWSDCTGAPVEVRNVTKAKA